MSEPPVVDGRDRDELLEQARERALAYTDEWDPTSDDVGPALLQLFAVMAEDVVERLDRVPEKYRIAFFDTLGFDRNPPQPARLPLTFPLVDGTEENVAITTGTQAVAEATEERPEQSFEVISGDGFEATPASLKRVYSVDPKADRIFEHWETLSAGGQTTLFSGTDLQEHALYLSHSAILHLGAETTFQVVIETETSTDTIGNCLVWEYYGEGMRNGEPIEGWHPLNDEAEGEQTVVVTLDPPGGDILETDIAGMEARWIRCRLNQDCLSSDLFGIEFQSILLDVGSPSGGIRPDELLVNDVSLDPGADRSEAIFPFGELPRQQDAFYIASEEAFTKAGASAELMFSGADNLTDLSTNFDLSWEYWDGEGWARLDLSDGGGGNSDDGNTVTFDIPSDLEATSVSGHDGHWIRIRWVGGDYGAVTYTRIGEGKGETELLQEDIPGDSQTGEDEGNKWTVEMESENPLEFSEIQVSYSIEQRQPEHLVTENNLTYSDDLARTEFDGFRPFVGPDDDRQTLYLGFDKPLRDGPVQLFFSMTSVEYAEGFYPRLRWEYCTDSKRDEWSRLTVQDETESLTQRGIISLVFPDVTTSCERFGQDRHWIRARVTGDKFTPTGPTEEMVNLVWQPLVVSHHNPDWKLVKFQNIGRSSIDLSDARISFERDQPVEQVRTFPNGTTLTPGASLSVATEATATGIADITFGFEGYNSSNSSLVKVALLTPSGTEVTVQSVTESESLTDESDEVVKRTSENDSTCGSCVAPTLEPCGTTVQTTPPAGEPATTPPVLLGIHLNTGWVYNIRSIDEEILGSSDGTATQTFAVSSPPATDAEVWVDELSARSEGARQTLMAAQPSNIVVEEGPEGETRAFWVRWQMIDDFLDSGPDDRHYTLDPTAGTVTFGDGRKGQIPPHGRDNVRTSYRTGGGTEGNVEQGTVTTLKSPIPLVNSITNPEPGKGGADAESTEQVITRAPKQLRDRGRAVCAADFERIAMTASRRLARARCIPGLDEFGQYSPGWVTLLIVPTGQTVKPIPSIELKHRVQRALRERAPATLVGHDGSRLVVRGPSYVSVSVEAALETEGVGSISAVEEAATRAVETYLHPLTGGLEDTGWAFGELPCLSDFYALLEGIDGVDHITDLTMTITGSEAPVTLTEGEEPPSVTQDALVFSGTHDIEATGGT